MKVRTCGECKHFMRKECPEWEHRRSEAIKKNYTSEQMAYIFRCSDSYVPNITRAWKDLGEVIAAPFIPLLDKLEKWLEERGKR